ncbi:YpfB family protein [Peribacillus sp. NPDC097295]|uniref:YpfB family protein n=1 Tax=Peribacillus sp. NPDC097295 TaxID=3364402 RepID=UPI0038272152
MRTFERLLIKVIVIQLICLLFFQLLLSRENRIFELTKLSKYEGVNTNNYTKIIETFNGTIK